jgi:phage-related protein
MAGHELDQVQHGRDPDDWKPMPSVGPGAREIRVREAAGAFRVVYVAKLASTIYVLHCFHKLASTIYVLHCFQKKTRATRKSDLDLAQSRYRDLLTELGR